MKVGDYVRTKDGYIGKAMIITEYNINIEDKKVVKTKDIIKSSSNIIDLIQEDDYVNGYLIEKVYDVFETSPNKLKEAHIKYADEDFISQLYDTEIKSIVTKEQFESIQYEVK